MPWSAFRLGGSSVRLVLLDLPFPLAGPLPVWRSVFAWFALTAVAGGFAAATCGGPREIATVDAGNCACRFVAGWLMRGGLVRAPIAIGVYDTMHLYGGMSGPLAVCFRWCCSGLYLGFWFGALCAGVGGL